MPHVPFPGLLCDGPPMARLRKLRVGCICHRQRRPAIPLAPRRSGESKGATRVAAKASTRGCRPRIPLSLSGTSDKDCAPHTPAALNQILRAFRAAGAPALTRSTSSRLYERSVICELYRIAAANASSQAPYRSPPPSVAKAHSFRCSSFSKQSISLCFEEGRRREQSAVFVTPDGNGAA